jgi:hypothetical protein
VLVISSFLCFSAFAVCYFALPDSLRSTRPLKRLKDINPQGSRNYEELSVKRVSRIVDGWNISFTLPLPEIDFRVEVIHNEKVIAYGLYWMKDSHLRRDEEYNMYLTIAYEPAQVTSNTIEKRSERESNNKGRPSGNSIIRVPDRTGGRNRRIRRGS